MRVRINKTRCQDKPISDYGALRTQTCLPAQVGNLIVGNAKRPDKTGLAGAIADASVLYDQIVHALSSFLPL